MQIEVTKKLTLERQPINVLPGKLLRKLSSNAFLFKSIFGTHVVDNVDKIKLSDRDIVGLTWYPNFQIETWFKPNEKQEEEIYHKNVCLAGLPVLEHPGHFTISFKIPKFMQSVVGKYAQMLLLEKVTFGELECKLDPIGSKVWFESWINPDSISPSLFYGYVSLLRALREEVPFAIALLTLYSLYNMNFFEAFVKVWKLWINPGHGLTIPRSRVNKNVLKEFFLNNSVYDSMKLSESNLFRTDLVFKQICDSLKEVK